MTTRKPTVDSELTAVSNRFDVGAYKAGPILDELIATQVLGWRRIAGNASLNQFAPTNGRASWIRPGANVPLYELPKFSTDMTAAWDVVNSVRSRLFSHRMKFIDALQREVAARVELQEGNRIQPDQMIFFVTAIDICLAALKAVEGT